MAITAATQLDDFDGFLSPEESAPIFEDAARISVAQTLFPQTPLGISGQKIPYVSTKPTANWVGEGEQKPATRMGLDLRFITPKKLAAIAVMSSEVVRANPGNYSAALRAGLSEAFAIAFDLAVFHDKGGDGTGSGPFDHSLSETTKEVALGDSTQEEGGIYADFNDGLRALVNDTPKRRLTGFALDSIVEPEIRGAVDKNGRPLWVDLPTDTESDALAQVGRLLGRRSAMSDGVANGDIVGFGGNFRKGAWGVIGGINFKVSSEATVTINGELTSLWENNLVAVLAEAEYGFVVTDVEEFVKYTLDGS